MGWSASLPVTKVARVQTPPKNFQKIFFFDLIIFSFDWSREGGAGQVLHPRRIPAHLDGFRRRQTLLLSALSLRRRHGEHPARLQRLPRHHPAHAPAPVRAL